MRTRAGKHGLGDGCEFEGLLLMMWLSLQPVRRIRAGGPCEASPEATRCWAAVDVPGGTTVTVMISESGSTAACPL